MAKIDHIIRAELTPYDPIPEIMQVVSVMLKSNPGREAVILTGLSEAITVLQSRFARQEKGDKSNGN